MTVVVAFPGAQLDAGQCLHCPHQLAHAAALGDVLLSLVPQGLVGARQPHVEAGVGRDLQGDIDVLDHEVELEWIVEAAIQDALRDVRATDPATCRWRRSAR